MAVPRTRVSNRRKNTRRSHDAKKGKTFTSCNKCGNARLPHTMCQSCGWYGNRQVVEKGAEE